MQLLRQSTAATVVIGPAVDITDGVTAETALAAGTVDEIGVYKHDATALTDISGTTTLTHRANGWYTATLSTADTGTLGRLTLSLQDADVCLPLWQHYMVVPANEFDSLVLGTDALDVEVASVAAGAGNTIADALLTRDWTAVTGEAARSVLNALRFLRNKWSISGSTLTVTEEDDATSAWTSSLTSDSSADPVTGSDPT